MRTWFAIAAAALQLAVLAFMAGQREWILRTGRTVWLRTVPVDPRDAFRGDYVHLDYEISHVPNRLLRDGLVRTARARAKPDEIKPDTRVYAALREAPGGVPALEFLSDRRPDGGLFVCGRTERGWGGASSLRVRYGVEALFVQEGSGRVIEEGRRRGDVQVPLEMAVAVSPGGTAVLKGYRWSTLGIALRLEMTTNRLVRGATVGLVNVSSNPLAIVNLPDTHSWTLVPDEFRGWGESAWTWVGTNAVPAAAPTDADVVLLKPDERREITIDLTDPAWFVAKAGEKPQSLSGLQSWDASFRFLYRVPPPEACSHLKDAALIWHGEMVSRAFGGGRVD